jgi:hypothetical protein
MQIKCHTLCGAPGIRGDQRCSLPWRRDSGQAHGGLLLQRGRKEWLCVRILWNPAHVWDSLLYTRGTIHLFLTLYYFGASLSDVLSVPRVISCFHVYLSSCRNLARRIIPSVFLYFESDMSWKLDCWHAKHAGTVINSWLMKQIPKYSLSGIVLVHTNFCKLYAFWWKSINFNGRQSALLLLICWTRLQCVACVGFFSTCVLLCRAVSETKVDEPQKVLCAKIFLWTFWKHDFK